MVIIWSSWSNAVYPTTSNPRGVAAAGGIETDMAAIAKLEVETNYAPATMCSRYVGM